MAEKPWEDLTESELEHLLVDRWLYRGGVLAMLLAFGVLITILASRGVDTLLDKVMVAALIFFALVSAGVFVYLREQDRRIYRVLRERRREGGEKPGASP